MAINSDIRVQLLTIDDTDVLSDTYVNLMVTDAKTITKISDETSLALRYYSCYLIAKNWESLNAIESREGVKYRKPEPEKYLLLYNEAIKTNNLGNQAVVAVKESTNEGNIIAENGVMEKGDYPLNGP